MSEWMGRDWGRWVGSTNGRKCLEWAVGRRDFGRSEALRGLKATTLVWGEAGLRESKEWEMGMLKDLQRVQSYQVVGGGGADLERGVLGTRERRREH